MSDVECRHCGNTEAMCDFDYKRNETRIFCDKCGYQYNELLDQDEEGRYKKDEEGHYIYKEIEITPYCSFRIQFNKGGQIGTLETKEQYDELKKFAKGEARDRGVKYIETSRFIDGEFIKKRLKLKKGIRKFTLEDPYGEEDWSY